MKRIIFLIILLLSASAIKSHAEFTSPYKLGKHYQMTGIAEDCPYGPLLRLTQPANLMTGVVIDNLEVWPADLYGKEITVEGTLISTNSLLDPKTGQKRDFGGAHIYTLTNALISAESLKEIQPTTAVVIKTPQIRYKAQFKEKGGMQDPNIPLEITITNSTGDDWSWEHPNFILGVDTQYSKRHINNTFQISERPIIIKKNTSVNQVIDVGEFLTGCASGYMKGDNLTVKASVTINAVNITSNAIRLRIFVPEG